MNNVWLKKEAPNLVTRLYAGDLGILREATKDGPSMGSIYMGLGPRIGKESAWVVNLHTGQTHDVLEPTWKFEPIAACTIERK